jgi:aspartokinase
MVSAKISLKRLKRSDPMVGISIHQAIPTLHARDALCRIFANHGLNLTFISTQQNHQKETFFCCLNAGDHDAASQLLDKTNSHIDLRYRIIPSVTLLSVFPHQSDIFLVVQLLQTLWASQIRVHAVASSIAALTLVVDTNGIEAVVEALQTFLDTQTQNCIDTHKTAK